MWTVLWVDDGEDRWDRLETREEVEELIEILTKNPNVCETDAWIFPPKSDDYALTPDLL